MRYSVKAVGPRNEVLALDLEAADEAAVREMAARSGYSVLSVSGRGMPFAARRATFPTTLFSLELRTLLDAGLSLVEALQALAERERDADRARVIAGVLEALAEGEPFSRALGRYPDAFAPLYVATVQASERTGNLNEALSRYVAYREDMDRVRKQFAAALIYPAILTGVGALVVAFLTFYVVPRFARVYEDAAVALPLFSALLLAMGRAVDAYGGILALIAIAATVGAAYALGRPQVRASLNRLLWRIPAAGERLRLYQLARFYRTTGMLLRAGVPVLRALRMVEGLLEVQLREALARAVVMIEAGQALSAALLAQGLATPVALRLMRVGEGSGRMGEMLDRVARFHDDENARFVESATRVFEPVLMAMLGLAVGGIVVLMYMPVFELAGSVR